MNLTRWVIINVISELRNLSWRYLWNAELPLIGIKRYDWYSRLTHLSWSLRDHEHDARMIVVTLDRVVGRLARMRCRRGKHFWHWWRVFRDVMISGTWWCTAAGKKKFYRTHDLDCVSHNGTWDWYRVSYLLNEIIFIFNISTRLSSLLLRSTVTRTTLCMMMSQISALRTASSDSTSIMSEEKHTSRVSYFNLRHECPVSSWRTTS